MGAMRNLLLAVMAVSAVGCAPGFRGIYPGMNGAEVTQAMGGRGPAQVQTFEQGYSSWYYNEDQCVLMKDNIVMNKDTSHSEGGVHVYGVGGFSMKQRAQCLPPGVMADPNTAVNVAIPGANIRIK